MGDLPFGGGDGQSIRWPEGLRPSDGEVHFLWSFSFWGSIMEPATRWALRRSWGFCQRHGLLWVATSLAFLGWLGLHGPAIVYEDLMDRARLAFRGPKVLRPLRLRWALRDREPCLACRLGYGPHSPSRAPRRLLAQGRQMERVASFLAQTAPLWRRWICPRCARSGTAVLCRRHLLLAITGGRADLDAQESYVRLLFRGVHRFSQSFRWERKGTDTVDDRACLVAAVGWCQGWDVLLSLGSHILPPQSGVDVDGAVP